MNHMKANKLKSPFEPMPGYIIAIPYVEKDQTFVSAKESAGDLQRSVVVSAGDSYIDDHGNIRQSLVKKGDVILHRYTSNTGTIGFDEIRAIHFSEVIGKKK